MPTIVAMYGAEHGSTDGLTKGLPGNRIFDTAVGTLGTDIQVIPAAAKNGVYGLRISGPSHYVGWNASTIGAPTIMTLGFWFRIVTVPSAEKEIVAWDFAGLGTDVASINYLPGGTLRSYTGGGTQSNSTLVVQPMVWYWFDVRYTITGTTHTYNFLVNGYPQGFASDTLQTPDTFTGVAFGDTYSSSTGIFDYDDILVSGVSGDYPLGPHRIVPLRVDQAAAHNGDVDVFNNGVAVNETNFRYFSTAVPSTSGYYAIACGEAIAEVPPRTANQQDGWYQSIANVQEYVQIPMANYTLRTTETVSGLRMMACCWAGTAGVGQLGFHTWNGTVNRVLYTGGTGADNLATPAWVCRPITNYTDFATQAGLDALALRVGFSSSVGTGVGLHSILVELALKDATLLVTSVTPGVVRAAATVGAPGKFAGATAQPRKIDVATTIGKPVVSISTTTEFWSIDGVSLHQYGWQVVSVGGSRYDVPTRRGNNMTLAYRPGTFHRNKMVESRVINLIMWLTAVSPSTGLVPNNPTVQWNDSWDFIRRLVFKPGGARVQLTRRWMLDVANPTLLTATADAELVDTLDPKMTGRTRADFAIGLLLADPYFYGSLVTANVNQGTSTSVSNPGHDNAGHNHMEVDFVGPLTNPRLTNSTPDPAVWVQYSGVVAAGQTLRLTIPDFTALRVGDNENLIGGISHSGDRLWMLLRTGANQLHLTAAGGAGTAQLRFQPPYA